MRRGFDGPARQVLGHDPFGGHLFVFRGRGGDLVKVRFWDGQGLCLYAKRLERGRLVWPAAKDSVITLTLTLTPAPLSMLLEGIDWRTPARTWRPEMAGGDGGLIASFAWHRRGGICHARRHARPARDARGWARADRDAGGAYCPAGGRAE